MVIGAHSSMAEQPAHNRSGLGSSPGGPTIVLERLHGLKRGWAAIESGGSARPVYRFNPLVRRFGAPLYRAGFSPFRSFPRSLVPSSGRWLFVPPLRSGTRVNRHVTNDTMESTWILN